MGISSSKRGSGGPGEASGMTGGGLGQSQAAWGAPSSTPITGARGYADAVKSGQMAGGVQGMAGLLPMFGNGGLPSGQSPFQGKITSRLPVFGGPGAPSPKVQPQPGPMAPPAIPKTAPPLMTNISHGLDDSGIRQAAAARFGSPSAGGQFQVTPQAMPVGGWRPPSLAEVQTWLASQGRDPAEAQYFLETM